MAKKLDVKAILTQYVNDYRSFASDCLFVRDHVTKQVLPFVFNNPQNILHEIAEKQKAELGLVRILVDKARREGVSTYIEGRYYWRTSLNFNRNTFIVGHEEDSTDTLFSMARLFHECNPLKPSTKYSSKKELLFDTKDGNGLKSEYGLACAVNTSAGRSQGLHYLHASELAFWPGNADSLLDGLMSCIPPPPSESEVFLESTGNGYGNRFQRDVFEVYAEGRYPYFVKDGIPYAWKKPDSDWVLVFIPWFAHEIYRREFDGEAQRKDYAQQIKLQVFNKELMIWEDSDEIKLQKRFGLSLEQLHWRTWTIANVFKGRVEKFKVEFPSTVEESFLSTGSNVYPASLCDILESNCKPPILVGDVVDRMGKTKIRPNLNGHFSIWEKPVEDETYFMTVDSAGGMKERHKVEKREPDPTCVDVYHHESGKQVAQWHGHLEYDLIADVVEMIGKLYNKAVACVELQNHGFTVVAGLKAAKYPMYEWKPGEPGWSTNTKTKTQMVDGLYEAARDGSLQILCRETVSEMRTFIEENGAYNAESGCHDERVDTAGMASQMMKLIPRVIKKKSKNEGVSIAQFARRNKEDGKYREVYVR